MARLPPPPIVGRGNAQDDADEAARAAAAAELPNAVVDLPEAWLEIPTFEDAPAQADPLVGISVAAPVVDAPADVQPEPDAPPPTPVVAPPEVAVVEAKPASVVPPPSTPTPPPRSVAAPPSDANRRTMIGAGAVLGAVLVVVMVIRCNSGGGTTTDATPSGKGSVATARTFDERSPDTPPLPTATRTGGEVTKADDTPRAAAANEAEAKAAEDVDSTAAAEPAADDAKAEDAKAGEDVVAIDEERPVEATGAGAGAKAPPASSSRSNPVAPSKPSPDANLTAAENLEKARAAWKAGNAKDTYKYANKSRFKEPSAEATELATLAACKMKLDEAAKTSFKQLEGDRKKRTRAACRDFGVRVGL